MDERLHKLLAQRGIGSRRQVEDWIREGRVLVNGQPASVGQRVSPGGRVSVDGRDVSKRLTDRPTLRVLIYHKPSGEMVRSRAGDDRAGIEERLPSLRGGRWLPVNSLAFGEDGLLILTSDGTLAGAIARNADSLPVEYRVRVLLPRDEQPWPEMPLQVEVEGERVDFTAVERDEGAGTNVWFRVAADRPLRRGALRALEPGGVDPRQERAHDPRVERRHHRDPQRGPHEGRQGGRGERGERGGVGGRGYTVIIDRKDEMVARIHGRADGDRIARAHDPLLEPRPPRKPPPRRLQ